MAIGAVIFPDIVSYAAGLVGVGRGTDLLLYLSILAFLSYALNNYVGRQKDKDALFRLARKMALLEAKIDNKKEDRL